MNVKHLLAATVAIAFLIGFCRICLQEEEDTSWLLIFTNQKTPLTGLKVVVFTHNTTIFIRFESNTIKLHSIK